MSYGVDGVVFKGKEGEQVTRHVQFAILLASGEFWLRSVHGILSERKNASSQRVSSATNERCVRHPPWVWKRRF